MRIRVKIDVRQSLKKEAKVKNREGAWCTVNFKYEKLGIFCFICGIMGHAENKCEIRYAMEQDDGRREWSADIRAEPRRQGGRLVSRWLREEKGGQDETSGSSGEGRVEQTNSPTRIQTSGAMVADVAVYGPAVSQGSNHQAIMTRQSQSMSNQFVPLKYLNGPTFTYPSNISLKSTANHIVQPSQMHSSRSFNPLINQFQTSPIPILKPTDNIITTLYSPSIDSQHIPLLTHNTETENYANQSSSNQHLVFTSQQNPSDPPRPP
jgi:hypothetical protein